MIVYWFIFAFWMASAFQPARGVNRRNLAIVFTLGAIATAVLIGFRYEVGADWNNYLEIYHNIQFLDLVDALRASDPAYGFLNWLGARLGLGIIVPNAVCGAVFAGGFFYLAWRQTNPALAVLVAVPYLIIVVAMGYTRQAAAIGLVCLAIADASERRLIRLVFLVGLAALFHKSAILMLPIMLAPVLLRNSLLGLIGVISFVILFYFVLRSSTESMVDLYVTSNYDSQGAFIRVAMNVLAAGVFLKFRKQIVMPYFQSVFWTCCSILAILSLVALVAASASSGVDRFSLYLIPLQAIIYSRLPYLSSRSGKAVPSILLLVIAYSFLVQAVWLNFADNAQSWLPYQLSLNP